MSAEVQVILEAGPEEQHFQRLVAAIGDAPVSIIDFADSTKLGGTCDAGFGARAA